MTTSIDLDFGRATDIAGAIERRDVSAVEVLDVQVARIMALNPRLNAIVTIDTEGGRAAALEADRTVATDGPSGPLHGLAVTLKDSHAVAGMRSTIGVPDLGDRVPAVDGTVARRLRAAGAIILGKTNVSERLYDIQTNNPLFGRTNNPWSLDRTPGGSSGGAAAAVASGMSSLDVGSDLGGSIRIPASFCGVVGFKPTEGRIPETGHIDTGRPRSVRVMESISPIARSVADVELLFSILAGPDGLDSTVPPVPLRPEPTRSAHGLRVAVAADVPGVRVQAATRDAVTGMADDLARDGAIVEAALPDVDWRAQFDVRSALFRITDTVFGDDADPTAYQLADYLRLLEARDHVIAAWERFFERWDVLLTPTTNSTAFPHRPMGTAYEIDGEEVPYWSTEPLVHPMNLIGAPAISLPCGLDADGLPIGIQLTGPRWGDERLLAIARSVEERAGGFRRPPLAAGARSQRGPGRTTDGDIGADEHA